MQRLTVNTMVVGSTSFRVHGVVIIFFVSSSIVVDKTRRLTPIKSTLMKCLENWTENELRPPSSRFVPITNRTNRIIRISYKYNQGDLKSPLLRPS